MPTTAAFRLSAVVGFLAVALGAFGAHGLKGVLAQHGTVATWETAALYHLVHAVVLVWLAARDPRPVWAWRFFFAGVMIFSGSLYVLAVTGVKMLGAITPVGGLCLLAGWLSLAMVPPSAGR
jgi:uncharacterized membrane protein YgdD (TMEM256/DUF423 family)